MFLLKKKNCADHLKYFLTRLENSFLDQKILHVEIIFK